MPMVLNVAENELDVLLEFCSKLSRLFFYFRRRLRTRATRATCPTWRDWVSISVGTFVHRPQVRGVLWFVKGAWPDAQETVAMWSFIVGMELLLEVLQILFMFIVVEVVFSLQMLYKMYDTLQHSIRSKALGVRLNDPGNIFQGAMLIYVR
jgi:hypothetical protein